MKFSGLWNTIRHTSRAMGFRNESTVATTVQEQMSSQNTNHELASRISHLEGGRVPYMHNITMFGMTFAGIGFIFNVLKGQIDDVKKEVDDVRKEVADVRKEVVEVRKDVAEVRNEMHQGFLGVQKTMFELFKQRQLDERSDIGLAVASNSKPSGGLKL